MSQYTDKDFKKDSQDGALVVETISFYPVYTKQWQS